MSDKQRTWECYVSAWKEATADGKAAALRRSASPACVYQDPLTIASGHDQLIAYMQDLHRQVPGAHFITTWFLAHHDVSIAKWNMASGDGTVIGDGVSYGRYDAHGMLVGMTGFFEAPPR